MYKLLLRLDFCVHDEQTSAGDTGAGQTSVGAGRLGKGWTTSPGAGHLILLFFSAMFLSQKICSGQACYNRIKIQHIFYTPTLIPFKQQMFWISDEDM